MIFNNRGNNSYLSEFLDRKERKYKDMESELSRPVNKRSAREFIYDKIDNDKRRELLRLVILYNYSIKRNINH
jgi:hypothetical protein